MWALIPGFVGVGNILAGLLGDDLRHNFGRGINLIIIQRGAVPDLCRNLQPNQHSWKLWRGGLTYSAWFVCHRQRIISSRKGG